jgi:dihydrofolate reductase
MATTYLHAVASLDGYIADANDDPGPLFDWYYNGTEPIVEDDSDVEHQGGTPFRISAASADYVRGIWERQSVIVVGRHLFDITNGWEGRPPACERAVIVPHRPKPEGWHPEAPYDFVDSVEGAVARAQELAGDGEIGICAGDVGGQALALGLVDHVAIDVVPIVFGGGKSYFGTAIDAPAMLKDPDVVIQGDRVLHLRYPVRR